MQNDNSYKNSGHVTFDLINIMKQTIQQYEILSNQKYQFLNEDLYSHYTSRVEDIWGMGQVM